MLCPGLSFGKIPALFGHCNEFTFAIDLYRKERRVLAFLGDAVAKSVLCSALLCLLCPLLPGNPLFEGFLLLLRFCSHEGFPPL